MNSTEELNKLSIRELINLQAKINKMIEAKKRENYYCLTSKLQMI